MPGDCRKSRCALRAENDDVGLLRVALVEQLLGGIAGHHNALDRHLALQPGGNQRKHIGFHFIERAAGKKLLAFLGADDVLQDEARAMLRGQLGRIGGHHGAGFVQADRAENGARSKVAIAAVDHFGADDVNRHIGGAQNRLGHRTHQQLADGTRRVRSHHNAVDLALVRKGKNFVCRQSRPHHNLATQASFADRSRQRLQMLLFILRSLGVVVVTDGGGLRRGHGQCVIDVEEDEIRTKLLGLCQSECESLLVGRYLGGKEDGGGFAPT